MLAILDSMPTLYTFLELSQFSVLLGPSKNNKVDVLLNHIELFDLS